MHRRTKRHASALCLLAALSLGTACAGDEDLSEPSTHDASPEDEEHTAHDAATSSVTTNEDARTKPTDDGGDRAQEPDASRAPSGSRDAAVDAGAVSNPARDAGSPLQDASSAPDAAAPPVTLFLAGDSIVQSYTDTASDRDQAGWGQMLGAYFDKRVTVENHAIGGRTARRFIDEKLLDAITRELAPGDYLLVEFGTNDGNKSASYMLGGQTIPYFLDPQTDFKSYLQRYVDAARARQAIPVFVTPPPRNSAYCTGGNGTSAYAAAMNELGRTLAVPVVDLNARTVAHLRAICPAPNPEDFFLLRADGSVDGTHFQERGARVLAGFVADELVRAGLSLGAYRVEPR